MKIFFLLFLLSFAGLAQTKTTVELDKKYEGMSLFFYKNTLKMLNQTDDKDFDALIKDIEKMRFVMVNKKKEKFSDTDLVTLKKSYHQEGYEPAMTSRFEGRNFDVFLRESNGNVKGTVILASDSSSLYVLDILGKIALNKVGSLFSTLDGSTDIGKKIKDFANGGADKMKKKRKEQDEDDEKDEDEIKTKKN